MSGRVVATGALVGGPIWVGMVPGILLVLLLRRTGQQVDPLRLAYTVRRVLMTLMNAPRPTDA